MQVPSRRKRKPKKIAGSPPPPPMSQKEPQIKKNSGEVEQTEGGPPNKVPRLCAEISVVQIGSTTEAGPEEQARASHQQTPSPTHQSLAERGGGTEGGRVAPNPFAPQVKGGTKAPTVKEGVATGLQRPTNFPRPLVGPAVKFGPVGPAVTLNPPPAPISTLPPPSQLNPTVVTIQIPQPPPPPQPRDEQTATQGQALIQAFNLAIADRDARIGRLLGQIESSVTVNAQILGALDQLRGRITAYFRSQDPPSSPPPCLRE